VNRYSQSGNEADLNPKVANRNKRDRKKPTKNYFSDEALEKLEDIFLAQCFQYQRVWYDAGLKHCIRDILKSRQIGATFFFAREALLRALPPGITRFFCRPVKPRLTFSVSTSFSLRAWSMLN
jgi:uncharacterized protein YjcR